MTCFIFSDTHFVISKQYSESKAYYLYYISDTASAVYNIKTNFFLIKKSKICANS